MGLKALYMFVNPTVDSTKHRATIDTPTSQILVVGVSSADEGARIAEQLVGEGVELIELCGGFGYDGAKTIHDRVGNKVPVGLVMHQVWNAPKLAQVLGEGVRRQRYKTSGSGRG